MPFHKNLSRQPQKCLPTSFLLGVSEGAQLLDMQPIDRSSPTKGENRSDCLNEDAYLVPIFYSPRVLRNVLG